MQNAYIAVMEEDSPIDFCYQVTGNDFSRIKENDIVLFQRQDKINDRDVIAVQIGEEVYLKRVFFCSDTGDMILYSDNSKIAPIILSKEDQNNILILGKAVGFQSQII